MAKSKAAVSAPKSHPSHGVYAVEGEGQSAYWTKIGCAWQHGDGNGFNVSLSAVPFSRRLVLRTRTEKEGGE